MQSDDGIFFCRNKMYGTRREPSNASYSRKLRIFCYHTHSCRWKFLPPLNDGLLLKKLFVYNDEMYALFLRHKGPPVTDILLPARCSIVILKYKVDSNSWEDVLFTEGLACRRYYCVVPSENFVYFIGGTETWGGGPQSDVYRYDLCRKIGINQQTFRRRDRNSFGEQRRTEKYILLDGLQMK